jgi:hypothetical protein
MAISKVGLTTAVTGTLPVANGGTAITSGFVNGNTKGLVHISTTSISSGDSEVELTFSSSYDNYRIIMSNTVPDTGSGGTYIKIIVKRSGQGSYDTSSGNYWFNGYDMYTANSTMNGQGNKSQSAAQVLAWNQNNTQYNGNYNIIEIGAVNQNTYHLLDCFSQQLQYGNNGDQMAMSHYHFAHTQAAALTNIKILPNSGNFLSGKVLFFGYGES